MSARDAESGSSTYKGGSGRAGGLGNGGIGGGMGGGGNWGGGMGGGAGRNGGMNSRTGLTTGNGMFGGMAFGRPGGMAMNLGSPVAQGPKNNPPGFLGSPVPASIPGVNPVAEIPKQPSVMGYLPSWPGTGMWWGDQPTYLNNSGLNPPAPPASLPPYYGPGSDPRVTSVPSPHGNPQYSMFSGNYNSVYSSPQLGTPGFGSLSNLKSYTGANYGSGGSVR